MSRLGGTDGKNSRRVSKFGILYCWPNQNGLTQLRQRSCVRSHTRRYLASQCPRISCNNPFPSKIPGAFIFPDIPIGVCHRLGGRSSRVAPNDVAPSPVALRSR